MLKHLACGDAIDLLLSLRHRSALFTTILRSSDTLLGGLVLLTPEIWVVVFGHAVVWCE